MVLGGGGAAGEDGDVLLLGVGDELGIKAGADDEVAAHRNDGVNLRGGGDGAGADEHIGAGFLHELDGLVSAGSAEGDLRHGDVARAESLRKTDRVALGIVELDDRHHADGADLLIHGIHGNLLLMF